MRAVTRLAMVVLAAVASVGATTTSALAAEPGAHVSVGPVLLGSQGDHVRLRYSCSGEVYVHVMIREGSRAMMTGRYPEPLTCTGHVRTEWFFLENLPTGTKGLVPGRGTATIGLYHAISGPADSSTEQRVRIFPTRR